MQFENAFISTDGVLCAIKLFLVQTSGLVTAFLACLASGE